MIVYRCAKKKDREIVVKFLVEAFADYPFCNLLALGMKNPEKFKAVMHRVNIFAYIRKQACFVGVKDGQIVSAALIKQRKFKPEPNIFDFIAAGGVRLLFIAGIPKLWRLKNLLAESESACRQLGKDAWYLEQLGVDQALQSQHFGSKMLNDCLKPYIAKQGGGILSLMTHQEKNRAFYAKNGFSEFAETVVQRDNLVVGNWSYKITIPAEKNKIN